MSKPVQTELGWYQKQAYFGDELKLAEYAVSAERGMIDPGYALNGYITTTLYPNDMYYVTYWEQKPPRKYFGSSNACIFKVVAGVISALYSFHDSESGHDHPRPPHHPNN